MVRVKVRKYLNANNQFEPMVEIIEITGPESRDLPQDYRFGNKLHCSLDIDACRHTLLVEGKYKTDKRHYAPGQHLTKGEYSEMLSILSVCMRNLDKLRAKLTSKEAKNLRKYKDWNGEQEIVILDNGDVRVDEA